MRNRSSKSKSAYTCQRRFAVIHRPGSRLRLNAKPAFLKIQFRVLMFKMKALRDKSVAKSERNFDDSRHSPGSFGVANVGFHRTDSEGPGAWAIFFEPSSQRLGLNLVTDTSSGSVGFHVKQVACTDTCIPERCTQQSLLCLHGGTHQFHARTAIVGNGASPDNGVYTVILLESLRQAFQYKNT